ncbi:uncharacterized 50 kDa protein in type I retrotransposable element R1DM isoform X1 [Bicyclus anynana]|uniref:Uncharacterized 50 kDa protein in type I retrotransposable element R1DM isoform X1 n=1 Tax=Bicyclus anynana TaxID=110368 RepID=A0ABM3LM36_BICAN|nr:uncharacterized 50 kDa protein in type I retrotransposable element R1DM isoform X1 [Bicyclus anynana]
METQLLQAKLRETQHKVKSGAPAADAPLTAPVSYSSALRLGRKAEPVPIRQGGPVLAFYPAGDQTGKIKTAEETKAELKRSIKPAEINVQVARVRKVGNAGVVVQTTSPLAADRLRNAVPPTLRVTEPTRRSPRICLRDLDGDPAENDVLAAIYDQNLRASSEWSHERVAKEGKVYKRRGRRAGSTTVIIECSPALRDALVNKGHLYIGWQSVEALDHVQVTCCNKCQQYGHPEKYCRATAATCGKCGATGHQKAECQAPTAQCATCHKFGRTDAATHTTASRSCPARRYAKERAVASTNYG